MRTYIRAHIRAHHACEDNIYIILERSTVAQVRET